MAYNFIPFDRDQQFLMPPSLREWLPEGDLAWFVIDAVAAMDLRPFLRKYRADGWGRAALHPQMMLGLLVYAYCMGERSSRKIERLCMESVPFRVVSANQKPDHTSIARFRQKHEVAITDLFVQVLAMCARAGVLKLGVVAIDGTKLKANAALEANRTYGHLKEEVRRMMSEAQGVDTSEDAKFGKDRRGDELPEDLQTSAGRLAKFQALKAELEQRAQAQPRRKGRAKEVVSEGESLEPDPAMKINLTDPESRILKARRGFVQGFNAQAAVTVDQFVLAAHITRQANDVHQLHPVLAAAKRNLRRAGHSDTIGVALADAGYWSKQNFRQEKGTRLLLATKKAWRILKEQKQSLPPRGRIPQQMSLRDRMTRRLLTQEGRELYKLRGQSVEPFFGTTKTARGCGHLMRRGRYAAQSEWNLICATHNLVKLWRQGARKG